jgi:hypothetical protein
MSRANDLLVLLNERKFNVNPLSLSPKERQAVHLWVQQGGTQDASSNQKLKKDLPALTDGMKKRAASWLSNNGYRSGSKFLLFRGTSEAEGKKSLGKDTVDVPDLSSWTPVYYVAEKFAARNGTLLYYKGTIEFTYSLLDGNNPEMSAIMVSVDDIYTIPLFWKPDVSNRVDPTMEKEVILKKGRYKRATEEDLAKSGFFDGFFEFDKTYKQKRDDLIKAKSAEEKVKMMKRLRK